MTPGQRKYLQWAVKRPFEQGDCDDDLSVCVLAGWLNKHTPWSAGSVDSYSITPAGRAALESADE